jgi:TonB family protein
LVVAVVDGCRDELPLSTGRGRPNVLGQKVSEGIRTALREAPEPVAQIDYALMQEAIRTDAINPADICDHRMAAWFALDLGAKVVLLPRLQRSGDELEIQTHVIRASDQTAVMRLFHRAPATPDALVLFELVPELPKPPLPDEGSAKVHRAGRDAVGLPACLRCPNPAFTKGAVAGKYQGSIILRLVVSAEGRPERITVVRGAPFGLSQAATDTVKEWRFKPATNAQGQPVPVWTTVEITFRQY